ncbi:MAG: site-specific integrase [Acidaminococcaceae bacterium]
MARNKKREDGRVKVSKTFDGKRMYFYGATDKAARAKLAEFEAAQQELQYNSDMLYMDWIIVWLDITRDNLSPSTIASYKQVIDLHILPELGAYALCNLSPILLRKFIADKKATGLSSRTVDYIYTLIKASLKQAVFDDLLQINPMTKVQKPKVTKTREMVALTKEQAKQLIDTIATDEIKRLFSVALSTGLRRSELLGLRWQDIDFEHKTLSVRQTVIKVKSITMISKTTKNQSSNRTISLDDKTLNLLKKQKTANFAERIGNQKYINFDLVFPGANGNPRNPDWVTKMARDYGKKIGLPQGFNFHSLRHTHATLLLKAGVHFKLVQSRLGHATFAQTMDTYSHITPDLDIDVAQKIATIF